MSHAVVDAWVESLQAAYGLAKGTRRNELAGRYVKRFDERGIHPYSYTWGVVRALESLEPVLANGDVSTDPVTMRRLAVDDAESEFLTELRDSLTPEIVEDYIASKGRP